MSFAAARRAYMRTDDQEIINIPIHLPWTMEANFTAIHQTVDEIFLFGVQR